MQIQFPGNREKHIAKKNASKINKILHANMSMYTWVLNSVKKKDVVQVCLLYLDIKYK